jgi:hypothetical protein
VCVVIYFVLTRYYALRKRSFSRMHEILCGVNEIMKSYTQDNKQTRLHYIDKEQIAVH